MVFLRILASASLASAALVGDVAYSTIRTRDHAQHLCEGAARLELGQAGVDDLIGLARANDGNASGFADCGTNQGSCVGTVYFENKWLSRFHVAPRTAFQCKFTILDNRLEKIWLVMATTRRGKSTTSEWGAFVHFAQDTRVFANESANGSDSGSFRVAEIPSSELLGVVLTPKAPAEIRRSAFSFNFTCMSKIGGCKNYEQMLPVLKRIDSTNSSLYQFSRRAAEP